MQRVTIDDPMWQTTLPSIIAPLTDEWFPGLLLRCDMVNAWEAGTTLALLKKFSQKRLDWYARMHRYIYIAPYLLNLDKLAQFLAISTSAILATTYWFERLQLYHSTSLPERLISPFSFHLCPECLAESLLLRRALVLPHITNCPQHHFALLNTCQCGSSLHLFTQQSRPFTCNICGVDWADLPRIEASPERIALEHDIMLWYEFFFSKGTLISFTLEMELYREEPSERKVYLLQQDGRVECYDCNELTLLGGIASSLATRTISPSDLINYEDS